MQRLLGHTLKMLVAGILLLPAPASAATVSAIILSYSASYETSSGRMSFSGFESSFQRYLAFGKTTIIDFAGLLDLTSGAGTFTLGVDWPDRPGPAPAPPPSGGVFPNHQTDYTVRNYRFANLNRDASAPSPILAMNEVYGDPAGPAYYDPVVAYVGRIRLEATEPAGPLAQRLTLSFSVMDWAVNNYVRDDGFGGEYCDPRNMDTCNVHFTYYVTLAAVPVPPSGLALGTALLLAAAWRRAAGGGRPGRP